MADDCFRDKPDERFLDGERLMDFLLDFGILFVTTFFIFLIVIKSKGEN